ncbi:DUF3037 domain-containing protein [Auritidibacter ignavus]|uniref:DUF3037 domain-containing protein n=1 Tax=Auritidibacter ignavus TaxID=678932 RepID=UPI00109C2A18|nr:DUF3037 domain-containing protein [Auritidibacter ignavus]
MGDYTAWVLRYVPDSIRGEFVNIGVLVGGYTNDWAIRYVSNFKYANRLGGQADALTPLLKGIEARVPPRRTGSAPSGELAAPVTQTLPHTDAPASELTVPAVEEFRAHYRNILQLSEPLASNGTSARELASLLFNALVAEDEPQKRQRPKTLIREQYESAIKPVLRQQPRHLELASSVTASFEGRTRSFDFAVHDDQEAIQLTQAMNFQPGKKKALSDEIDAFAHRASLIRSEGATISTGSHKTPMVFNKDAPLVVVHNDPSTQEQVDLHRFAAKEWDRVGVDMISTSELADRPESALKITA